MPRRELDFGRPSHSQHMRLPNRRMKRADEMVIPEAVIEDASRLSGVDPALARVLVVSGHDDGDKVDDVIPVRKATFSAGKLKPSQTSMVLDKTLSMAFSMLLGKMPMGGDLGAVISSDGYILDGHHRWSAAIAAGGPGTRVGGYQAGLPGKDLIKVLNIVTKGMFKRNQGNPGKGNISTYTAANAEKAIRDLLATGSPFVSSEEVEQALVSIGGSVEEGIAKMSSNIGKMNKTVPSWAPDRSQMPVIEPDEVPAVAKRLNQGIVNWNKPLNITRQGGSRSMTASDREALIRLASSLPSGSEERRVILAGLSKQAAGRPYMPEVTLSKYRDGEAFMAYYIDAARNHSKFYEMVVVPESDGTFTLKKMWGALGQGRQDRKDDRGLTYDMAVRLLARHGASKLVKGYKDAFKSRPVGQYPVGLERSVGFGWGTQAITKCVPALRAFLPMIDTALDEVRMDEARDLLAALESIEDTVSNVPDSMGAEITKLLRAPLGRMRKSPRYISDPDRTISELMTLKRYIDRQIRECNV